MVQDKYSEYLDSGLMWVREYPSHWSLTKVKYEAYVKARVGWHGLKTDDFTDVGPYLVTGSDFKSSIISWKDCYHCDLERYEQDPYIQLQNGDLLLTKDGTIGKIALVQGLGDDEKATLNSGVFVVRPLRDSFITEFYFWLLESSVFKKFVDYHKTGSTIVHLYQGTFVEFSYASPPLDEQAKIANFLDQETAQIDTLIEKQQALIQLLKEKRQAVISHAVTKGLNPDAPMKDSGVEWLGEVPEHWEVTKLGFHTSKIGSGKTPRGGAEVYQEEGVLFIRSQNVYDSGLRIDKSESVFISEVIHEEMSNTKVQGGDVLLNITGGSIGRTCIVPNNFIEANVNQHVCIVRLPISMRYFIAFILKSSLVKEQIDSIQTGGNREGLNFEQISKFAICLPPEEERADIVSYIETETKKIDSLLEQSNNAIQLMQERRTALISAAVTGKIDVRGWRAPE